MGYQPWLSVIGLYNYDATIFDGITLPDGLDKHVFANELLREAGELPLVYHDPDLLHTLFPTWSAAHNYKWSTLQKSTQLTYNPINNYDRTETWTETHKGESGETHGGNDTNKTNEANSGADTGSTSAEGFTDVAAFNSASLSPQDSTRTTGESTTNFGRNVKTDTTLTYGHTLNKTDNDNVTREGRASGNIGVTTTQQMLEQERAIADFSVYAVIIQDFMDAFCVQVW